MTIRILSSLSLAVLLASLAPQAKAAPMAVATGKDILKIATSAEFETLNPLIAEQGATRYMQYLAWRPLVVLGLDNKWIPMNITKIPTLENGMAKKNGEGLDINFEILPEMQWGDGVPVTCKDVEFAWRLGKHPNVSNSGKEAYDNITAITWNEKTPKKCMMTVKKAKYDYFASMIDPMPEHLEGPIFEKFKDQAQGYDHNTLYTKDPTNPGLYNGPFTVTDVKLGSHVMFSANPKFGGQKPHLKQILFKLLPNSSTHTTVLQAGDVDMFLPSASIGLDQALAFEKTVKAEKLPYKVVYQDGVVYAHIDVNLDVPGLNDIAVRKAMAHSINQKQINDSFFEGRAKPAIHNVTDKDPWYTEDVPKYPYNRREAIKILEAAGWKAGSDGIRVKDGKKLSFTIVGAAGTKIIDNIETLLQSQFKAIGIELKIKNEPPRVLFGETIKKRKYELAMFSWSSIPENTPRTTLHSTQIPSEQNSWSGQNGPGYKNPEVDKLIDALEMEFNAKKRAAIAKKILNYYASDLPVLPLYYRPTYTVIPADLKGYQLSGHMGYETLYAEKWSRK